jgi:hypothetical protein
MITCSCHCGAVRFEIDEPPTELTDCNCSLCRRIGGLWTYYKTGQVKMLSAPGATLIYIWGDKDLETHTCKTCGCTTHWQAAKKDAPDRMGINARMMEPAVIHGLRVKLFDGADSWKTIGWSVHPRPTVEGA